MPHTLHTLEAYRDACVDLAEAYVRWLGAPDRGERRVTAEPEMVGES